MLTPKLLFLWPGEGPSITESLGRNLEALDILRAKFGYVIYVPKDLPDYICVLGDDNDVMRHIGWRLRTKWSEAIANSSIKSKVYVIEPPEPSVMKKRVIVKKEAYLTRASLHGDSLTESESAYWVDRAKVIRFKNNARILAAIDKSLQGVSLVRGHLRMRVNFGTFILDLYRRPKDDNPSYSFGEFREMMFHEHSKGRLIPGYVAIAFLLCFDPLTAK